MLTLRFFVLTMDHRGRITWPAKFPERSRALMRKLAGIKLQAMLDSPDYPTHPAMASALTGVGDTFLTLQTSRHDPQNELE